MNTEGGGLSRTYTSQMAFRPYGGCICTPTAMLVSAAYIRGSLGDDPLVGLTEPMVRGMLTAAHSLYSDHYVKQNRQGASYQGKKASEKRLLLIEELKQFVPSDRFMMVDAAGMLNSQAAAPLDAVEGLKVCSLIELLNQLHAAPKRRKCAVMVTTNDHTVCFLFGEDHSAYLFDSIGATLLRITDSEQMARIVTNFGKPIQEYDALVLLHTAVAAEAPVLT